MAGTLFEKYGGFAHVSKIVMDFYDRAIESDVIGPYFEDTDMRRLIDHQTKFIAQVMGGPVSYSADALRRVHAPLHIDRAAFDEMATLLRETLEDFNFASEDVDAIMDHIMARAGEVISQEKT